MVWIVVSVVAFCLCHDHQAYVNTAYRYIRFIYNRVILENAPVRAAAVAAMAQFGATCPDLLPNIQVV
jgi:coatomer protein complex subunit gamma